jgi:hypothetical protein
MMRAAVIAMMVCLFIALLCAGCSPRVVETVVVRTDTLIQTKVEKDSVVHRDSVYVHEWQKGDTVYMEKVKWMERWRDRLLTDTLYISRTDRRKRICKDLAILDHIVIHTLTEVVLIGKTLLICIIPPHGNLHGLEHKLELGIALPDFIQFQKFFLQMLTFLTLNEDGTEKE